MANNQIVVIGASAGGIEALRRLAAALPAGFAMPISVVLHTSPHSPGILADILTRSGPLPAVMPRDLDSIRPGRIYVAPPDCHLLVEPGVFRVKKGPKENGFRPAIDPLFRSAAQIHGPAAVGVILTGNLDDGTAGLWAIKQLGGIAIVQDPTEALFPGMPTSALAHVKVDYTVKLADLAPLLVEIESKPVVDRPGVVVPDHLEVEVKIAKAQNALEAGLDEFGKPSVYACPECHGVLLQLHEGNRPRFRCHTGHAFSVETLLAGIGEGIEESLWNAVRALEEGGLLLKRMAEHLVQHNGAEAARLTQRADEANGQAESIRRLVNAREPLSVQKV